MHAASPDRHPACPSCSLALISCLPAGCRRWVFPSGPPPSPLAPPNQTPSAEGRQSLWSGWASRCATGSCAAPFQGVAWCGVCAAGSCDNPLVLACGGGCGGTAARLCMHACLTVAPGALPPSRPRRIACSSSALPSSPCSPSGPTATPSEHPAARLQIAAACHPPALPPALPAAASRQQQGSSKSPPASLSHPPHPQTTQPINPTHLALPTCRMGLRGLPGTRRLFQGLYLAMACLYIRNIFRFVEFTQNTLLDWPTPPGTYVLSHQQVRRGVAAWLGLGLGLPARRLGRGGPGRCSAGPAMSSAAWMQHLQLFLLTNRKPHPPTSLSPCSAGLVLLLGHPSHCPGLPHLHPAPPGPPAAPPRHGAAHDGRRDCGGGLW